VTIAAQLKATNRYGEVASLAQDVVDGRLPRWIGRW
jgi:hypothetical protein